MLRSGSDSAPIRWTFYGVTAACLALFAYGLFHVVRVALESSDTTVQVVLGVSALISIGLLAAAIAGVSRSRHPGGHFLVSAASLAGTFVSFVGLLMIAF